MSKDVKLKKKHRFLATKIIVIFSTVFVIAPVATFMGLFYVADTKDVSSVTPENITTTMTNRLFKSLDSLSDENCKLTLTFDDQTLDGLLMYVNQDIVNKTEAGNYLPKFYCTINDNKYNFYADVRTNGLKTRLELDTTLDSDTTYQLKFTIDNIKLGRLSVSKNIIGNIASKFINEKTINDALSNAGFNAEIDFEKMQLTYKRETFRTNMDDFLSKSTEGTVFNTMFSMLKFDNNPKLIDTTYTNGLSVILDLTHFGNPETPVIPEDVDLGLDLKDSNEKALKVVNAITDKGTYTDNDTLTNDLIAYINYGKKVPEASKDILDFVINNKNTIEREFGEGTADPETYKAKITKFNEELVSSQDLQDFASGSKEKIEIPYTDINGYINNQAFIGIPYSLSLDIGQKNTVYNAYVAMSNFGVKIVDGQLNVYIGADINGLPLNTSISINPAAVSIKDGTISMTISSEKDAIKIGDVKVDVSTIKSIAEKINKTGTSIFTFEKVDGSEPEQYKFAITFDALQKVTCNASISDGNLVLSK